MTAEISQDSEEGEATHAKTHANKKDAARALRELVAMITDPGVAPDSIAGLLDGLADPLRPQVVRGLGRRAQRTLYARVAGFGEIRLVDLVPEHCADDAEVRHLGRNTLPVFRSFEKRFARPPGELAKAPRVLAGYNFQALAPLTGPGYFVAREDPELGEVLVDYTQVPRHRPPAWPAIRANDHGLARLVYGQMIDRLRRVSEHVTIGSASRHGRDLGSWFVLCRVDR